MGDRGNIIFGSGDAISPAIYLHRNGGPESVYGFLTLLKRRGVGGPVDYVAARFVQLVGEVFDGREGDGNLPFGIVNGPEAITLDALDRVATDQTDNGFYVVAPGYEVRRFLRRRGGLAEKPPEWVERERRAAVVVHDYAGGLADLYASWNAYELYASWNAYGPPAIKLLSPRTWLSDPRR